MDLLVVGGWLPVKPQRRCREIVVIKQLLPGVPLDVLLLTQQEVESNFRNVAISRELDRGGLCHGLLEYFHHV